jgi:hypothetical protein
MPPNDQSRPGGGGSSDQIADDDDTATLPPTADRSALRQTLDDAIAAADGRKLSMKDLTVLSPQIDPFRLDTRANHTIGEWLADTAATLGLGDRRIHLRGLHYMIIGQPKPDGSPYTNTESDWLWLSGEAGKAARWLGYISFDQIFDQRNAEPTVRIFEEPEPYSYLTLGLRVYLPDVADIDPKVDLDGFDGVQPYKIVMIGEKSSLEPVLAPIATRYKSDLYLPTGCMSDTLIYQMAKIGAADGRPMVVFYFSDCDPSGWNMPIEVGRKLQAFRVVHFPELEFEVHRVALVPDQVREYGLPSTPLKATEKRGAAWQAAMGVEQTEIDALASLRPDLLRRIARNALDPFFDHTLDQRIDTARSDWLAAAQTVIDQGIDQDHLDRLRIEASAKLTELREEIAAINDALRLDVDDFDLPDIEPPEPIIDEMSQPLGLVDSRWTFTDQCRELIDSKAYRLDGS